jgi:hypothetical protein
MLEALVTGHGLSNEDFQKALEEEMGQEDEDRKTAANQCVSRFVEIGSNSV